MSSARRDAIRQRRQREADQPPPEAVDWQAAADPADLADGWLTYRSRAMVRRSDALAEWAAERGLSWQEACRRAGRPAPPG